MSYRRNFVVVVVIATVTFLGLFADWVYATGIGDDNSVTGRDQWLIWCPVVLGVLLLLASGVMWWRGDSRRARVAQIAGALAILLPSVVAVVVTEAVQSWLPTWLAPVLTNSDVLAFRAGVGAWIALVAGLGAVTIAVLGPVDSIGSASSSISLGAFIVMAVGAAGVMVLRARPFARVELSAGDQIINGVGGTVDDVAPDAVGDVIGDVVAGSSGEITVNLVAGDIPIVGQITLLATLVLVIAMVALIMRPNHVGIVVAGTAAGCLIFFGWLIAAVVETVDTVIPNSWLAVDGYGAVAASTTSSLWWLGLWSLLFTVGVGVTVSSLQFEPGDDVADHFGTVVKPEEPFTWGSN